MINMFSNSHDENKSMKARIELLEILAEVEDDIKNGRVMPASETFDDLRRILQMAASSPE